LSTWLGEPASVVDGKMIKRWCAAGMLDAERSFRRLKGYRQMPSSSLRSPVTSQLFHRHAMLRESHERTNGRTTARGRDSKLDARDDLGPKS
jgi:hypothetical protein